MFKYVVEARGEAPADTPGHHAYSLMPVRRSDGGDVPHFLVRAYYRDPLLSRVRDFLLRDRGWGRRHFVRDPNPEPHRAAEPFLLAIALCLTAISAGMILSLYFPEWFTWHPPSTGTSVFLSVLTGVALSFILVRQRPLFTFYLYLIHPESCAESRSPAAEDLRKHHRNIHLQLRTVHPRRKFCPAIANGPPPLHFRFQSLFLRTLAGALNCVRRISLGCRRRTPNALLDKVTKCFRNWLRGSRARRKAIRAMSRRIASRLNRTERPRARPMVYYSTREECSPIGSAYATVQQCNRLLRYAFKSRIALNPSAQDQALIIAANEKSSLRALVGFYIHNVQFRMFCALLFSTLLLDLSCGIKTWKTALVVLAILWLVVSILLYRSQVRSLHEWGDMRPTEMGYELPTFELHPYTGLWEYLRPRLFTLDLDSDFGVGFNNGLAVVVSVLLTQYLVLLSIL